MDDFQCTMERWRSQWAHLPLAFLPFIAGMTAMIALKLLERSIPEKLSFILMNAVGLLFVVGVVLLPGRWKKWKAAGRVMLSFSLSVSRFRFHDPVTEENKGGGSCTSDRILKAGFSYRVNSRFGGGTYQSPALVFVLDNGSELSIGGPGAPLFDSPARTLPGGPDFRMEAADFSACCALLGLAGNEQKGPQTGNR